MPSAVCPQAKGSVSASRAAWKQDAPQPSAYSLNKSGLKPLKKQGDSYDVTNLGMVLKIGIIEFADRWTSGFQWNSRDVGVIVNTGFHS